MRRPLRPAADGSRAPHRCAPLCALALGQPLRSHAADGAPLSGGPWLVLALALAAALAGVWWLRRRAPQGGRAPHDKRPARYGNAFDSTQVNPPDTVHDTRSGEPARQIGRYLIERDIGRGAMGMVLLARDQRSGETVALKTMALGREFQGEALEGARERFFREAEMAGRLHHPDIVSVYEAGEDHGTAYIAMEYLDGRDLSEFSQPQRLLPVATVVEIVARVARALAYAHRQGVTHRDIKPANIVVDLQRGKVKVTDFGIARVIDSTQTRTGLVLGTPSFMSPEQMAGSRVDGRSDLYALGVTLFQLLTGALPHRADSMAALIRAIANDMAPDVRSLRPELPAALAHVVALALEKRPEVRFADGEAMAADLHMVLADLRAAATAEPTPPATQAAAPARPTGKPPAEAGHNP